jgi:N-dimethylarginine dimethylaminohydrolase
MSAPLLMSYPSSDWQIRGGENFRSKERSETSPRAAMAEWLDLCDAITRIGGRILVMPPAESKPPFTGMIYTANSGALFRREEGFSFMISKMAVSHRLAEHDSIASFLKGVGLPTTRAAYTWEGQADITSLPGNRFLLTWGVRSVKESCDEVRKRLPPDSRVLEIQLRNPFFHGDTCLNPLTSRTGHTVLLAHEGALVDCNLAALSDFVGEDVEVFAVDEADALAYACNALSVEGTILAPTGLSADLRGQLVRRGFQLEELKLSELFGKGGGGPRCLANELYGFELAKDAPDYVSLRSRLQLLKENYPDRLG